MIGSDTGGIIGPQPPACFLGLPVACVFAYLVLKLTEFDVIFVFFRQLFFGLWLGYGSGFELLAVPARVAPNPFLQSWCCRLPATVQAVGSSCTGMSLTTRSSHQGGAKVRAFRLYSHLVATLPGSA